MTTITSASQSPTMLERVRTTEPLRHLLPLRLVAAAPLLGIGLAHVFAPEAPMRPLVEAAGFPVPGVLAPLAVAAELVAGTLLMLGLWARIGAALAIPTMLGAVYTHLVVDVWPNVDAGEPPIALPVIVLLIASYVLWRGAGRWSLDARQARATQKPGACTSA
jgi:putative oxidoreductase